MFLGATRHPLATLRCVLRVPLVRHASTKQPSAEDKAYSHTLLLPKTSFSQWSNPGQTESLLRRKTCDDLYRWQQENVSGPSFVLHDGPPYANGSLHIGHALNKIVKDVICRFHLSVGEKVHYIPGWDCHGLPIENKALQSVADPSTLTPSAIRGLARHTAQRAVDVQKTQFKHFGIMADWDNHAATYRTLDHDYEIRQLRVFREMVARGLIFRHYRPVHYSPSSRSALAEAELVYKDDHVSHSIFVSCALEREDVARRLGMDEELRSLVWTTTPWTMTANMAIAVHPDLDYNIVQTEDAVKYVVGADRLPYLKRFLGEVEVLKTVSGKAGSVLSGMRYLPIFSNPTDGTKHFTIVSSGHVTSESGTGLVHCAPAHGEEDYVLFRELGLLSARDVVCHVGEGGVFTDTVAEVVGPDRAERLIGKAVLDEGSRMVVEMLKEDGSLVKTERYRHKYPYDWKTDKPIIVTTTSQWFANLDGIKTDALDAVKRLTFLPPHSRNRLEAFVKLRSEWCISRQRVWGVPIPALRHVPTGTDVLTLSSLDHIISVLDAKGTEYWWDGPADEFVPPDLLVDRDGRSTRGQWEKGADTMDVWFDSGAAWSLLPLRDGRPRADVVVEGSDQHRGWFQSQLLTSVSVEKRAPFDTVLTHGMVLDEKGRKMSKSEGNVVDPLTVVLGGPDKNKEPAYGADLLRLWAATVEFSGRDMQLGKTQLMHTSEALRKLRNTIRFLLANAGGTVEPMKKDDMGLTERCIMHRLRELEQVALESYRAFNFARVMSSLIYFATGTLSTFYLDITKDTLYADAPSRPSRRDAVAVMSQTLRTLLRICAPVLPYLAEEAHHHFIHGSPEGLESSPSIFREKWEPLGEEWADPQAEKDMSVLLKIRGTVLKLLETARRQKLISTSMAAGVDISFPDDLAHDAPILALLRREEELLKTLFIVSDVTLADEGSLGTHAPPWVFVESIDEVAVRVRPAAGLKCPRCWAFTRAEGEKVCGRCARVLEAGAV
ncbi:tRNA synthetases class I-domain-containing protein [Vararia minispora EC-137]|uniref:tRNA synthetases class I-domain-containing protein n=1 Tax=Vararia minispora EC-137 TaxID=1314806 RepID=A0ACB8QZE1_9AGAM|nr:tRNA synthetases class I-domain-containing protein [Vararia minispora EC-137]